jgi:hypothetical protein
LPPKKAVDLLHFISGNQVAQQARKENVMSSKPTHHAYIVPEAGEGRNPFWYRVGSVFPHRNGNGFDLVLPEGISVSGRVVCTEPKEKIIDPLTE